MLQSAYFILELQKSSAFTKLKWSLNTLLLYRLREVELVMIGRDFLMIDCNTLVKIGKRGSQK